MKETTILSSLANNEALDIINELRIQQEKLKNIYKTQNKTKNIITRNNQLISKIHFRGKVLVIIMSIGMTVVFTSYLYLRYFYF